MPDRPRTKPAMILTLLFLGGMVNFFDRASLSVANTTVRGDLHLSATQMGWLLSAFSLAYGFAQLPLIPLLERAGSRLVLGAGLVVWSAAQMLTGLVRSFVPFLGLRVALGAGESPFYPAGMATIRAAFPREHRGRATAAMNTAQALSLALAPPLLTVAMLHVGWRWMFAGLGLLGVLVAAAWMLLVQEKRDEVVQAASSVAWRALLAKREVWGMMLGWGGINYTSWLYLAWLPGYLESAHHVSLAKTGLLAALPFLAGAVGMLLSGAVSDARIRNGANAERVHRHNLVLGMVASAAATLLVAHAATTAAAVACISVSLFAIHYAGTSGWGLVQSVGGREAAGSLGALQNFAGFMIASAAPVLTGAIVDRTHVYTLAFVVCAAVTLLGAASYAWFVAPGKQNA